MKIHTFIIIIMLVSSNAYSEDRLAWGLVGTMGTAAVGATPASPEYISHQYLNGAATNTGSVSLTVPDNTTLVVVGISAYPTGGDTNYISSGCSANSACANLTLASNNMTTGAITDSSSAAWQGMIFYYKDPSVGSNTLAWNFKGTANVLNSNAVAIYAIYFKGTHTDPVRSSGGQNADPMTNLTTGTLTAVTGDLTVGYAWAYSGGGGCAWETGTEKDEDYNQGNITSAFMTHAPTGNTAYRATISGDGGISGIVLRSGS